MDWERKIEEIRNGIEYKIENVVLDFLDLVSNYMVKNNVNQTKLAKVLNISNAAVSKLLGGNENISIKRMVEISDKLGFEISIREIHKNKISLTKEVNDSTEHFYATPRNLSGIENTQKFENKN